MRGGRRWPLEIRLGLLIRMAAFRNAYLLRGAILWFGIRLGAAFAQLAPGGLVQPFFIVAVVSGAVLLDARRRNEDLFLANLGISPLAIMILAAPVPVVLEALLLMWAR